MIDWRSRLLISERLFIRADVAVIILSTRTPPSMRARSLTNGLDRREPRECLPAFVDRRLIIQPANSWRSNCSDALSADRPERAGERGIRLKNEPRQWQRWRGDEVTGQRPVPPSPLPPSILRHHPSIDDPQPGYCLSRSPHSLTVPPPSLPRTPNPPFSACTAYNTMGPLPRSTRTSRPILAPLSRRCTRVYARRVRVCAMVTRHKSDSREISAPSCFSPLSFIGRTGAAC